METEIEQVTVPGHRHPLWLSRLEKDGVKCKMCEREILSSRMFSCRKCDFFICRSCSQLPRRFNHPFHPHHIVVLCHNSVLGCNVCSLLEPGYGYECEQCEFSLHLKCSTLNPTSKKNLSVNSHHQHPLIVCDKPYGYKNKCFLCDAVIAEEVYLCIKCGFMLDQWCALRPKEITHPFHLLQHSLKLYIRKPFGNSLHCSLCAMRFDSHTSVYSCSSCNFTVDVHCATLFPTARDSDPDKRIEYQPKTHPHSLITCSTNFNNFASKCYGCGLRFFGDDLIHVCLQCGILLHKSCADLPQEISHPFHPQHSLILFENSVNMTVHSSYYCRSCGNGSGEFVYICRHCDVVLDVKCATAKLHTIFISKIHPHPLAYFDIDIRESACHFCHSRGNKYMFRCVDCDFNVHDHCLPSLPQTIKHDCHCDPLTFTTAAIKDLPEEDEEQELYCHACEQSRKLADPTYFCSECHFVAHVHCVISETLPHLQNDLDRIQEEKDEEASTSGEKGKDSKVELDELNAEIGELEEEIDELAEELKELYNKRIQRVSTMLPIVKNKIRISSGKSEDTSQLLSYDKYLSRRFGHAFY